MNTQVTVTRAATEDGRIKSTARQGGSWRKRLVTILDRPGGRLLLAKIATHVARSNSGKDVAIKYVDGLWTRRVGGYFLPDGRRFEYVYSDFGAWENEVGQRDTDARDFWLQHYQPQESDVIFDVGAGRGEDILTFSRGVGKIGRVIALEADPVSFTFLRNFCRLNRLDNVAALHVAAMDKPGFVHITQSSSSWLENSVQVGTGTTGARVAANTIDAICERLGIREIAFLKMNIEGAERYALEGMKGVMPQIRQVCIACHDFRAELGHGEEYRTRSFVEGFLRRGGFSLESRASDPRDYVRDHIFGLR